ncbi:MAG: hypothetical protein LBQ99_00645 [Endomicrobium sp.]|jgi:lipid-A-disaccharide synthase|nr:hypothetical protein [Endomicrobium sp.]
MVDNKIFVSAGDLSGDIHASNLVKEIKKINPLYYISAVGGVNLKLVSDKFLDNIVSINAFGFFPIKQFLYLKKVLRKLEDHFIGEHPGKIILVDYYGFNIFVARLAKKLRIPVYYYISPQVWASRSGRIKELAKTVKKMLVILPFEEKLYKDNNVDAIFVGNPLIDSVPERQSFPKQSFGSFNPPTIGLFPGSRKNVIKRHIPLILKTAKILKFKLDAKFIMFSASEEFTFQLPEYIELCKSGDFERRRSIDFAICPSGTVSLENTLMGVPMVVIYKLSYFNYFFIRAVIKVKYITLVNILSDKNIVPEFVQTNAKPKKIVSSVLEQLEFENYTHKVKELNTFRKMLGTPGVNRRVAEIILFE